MGTFTYFPGESCAGFIRPVSAQRPQKPLYLWLLGPAGWNLGKKACRGSVLLKHTGRHGPGLLDPVSISSLLPWS